MVTVVEHVQKVHVKVVVKYIAIQHVAVCVIPHVLRNVQIHVGVSVVGPAHIIVRMSVQKTVLVVHVKITVLLRVNMTVQVVVRVIVVVVVQAVVQVAAVVIVPDHVLLHVRMSLVMGMMLKCKH